MIEIHNDVTLDEKVARLAGRNLWETVPIEGRRFAATLTTPSVTDQRKPQDRSLQVPPEVGLEQPPG